MNSLEKQFNDEMLQIYFQAKKELHYNATRFLQLISEKGGLMAAKQLIAKEGGTDGFAILSMNKRLDLTVEAHVLKPEYRALFSDAEIENCRTRLKELGYPV